MTEMKAGGSPHFPKTRIQNDDPAKAAGGGDKLPNRSQLLAAFGWWRVLIFSSAKKPPCNL